MEDSFNSSWFVRFIIEPRYRIFRHLVILLYVFVFLFKLGLENGNANLSIRLIHSVYFILMFYFNMYVLIPLTLFRGKYLSYLFLCAIAIMGSYILMIILSEYIQPEMIMEKSHSVLAALSFKSDDLGSLHELLVSTNVVGLMIFSSTSVKLFQRWARDGIKMNEIENNALQTELRELKNQINPHFLFNMLNNINVLVKVNPAKASLILVKLSGFLRYQLYDNNHQSVALASEVQFLKDFLSLENIRRDGFNYNVDVDNAEILGVMVPPNLFTTFVENAVKHSADSENASEINLLFKIEGQKLFFSCENTKAEDFQISKIKGLGLENIKRRLTLLYRDQYELKIVNEKQRFTVTLTFPL